MQRKGLIILLLLLTLAPTILAKSGSKKELFLLAESFYKAGNFKEAAKAYRTFIKNYPSSNYAPQALFHLGCTYKSLGKIDEAKASFDQLIKGYPKSSFVNYAYYEQAVLAYESKKIDETIKLLRKALNNCKDKKLAIKICFFLGNCYVDLNNYLAARGFYNEALANDLAKEYLRKKPETYIRLAELYFTYGDFEKAANAYLEIYRIYNKKPFAASALVKAADALFRCGKYTQAIETYAQVLKHYPYSEEFWISRFHLADIGEIVPNLDIPSTPIYKDYWNPIETYQEITRIPMPELAELAYLRIGSVFLKKGNYRKAVETFRDFLSTHPTSKFVQDAIDLLQDALSPIIDGFYKEKNYLDIVKIYEKNRLYLKKISNISLATKIADSYYYLGFYERALSIYKNFSLSAKNIIKVADIYNKKGDYANTISLLTPFIKSHHQKDLTYNALNLLAYALYRENRFEQAACILKKLVKKYKKDKADIYYLLAKCCERMGKDQVAIKYFKKAIRKSNDKRFVMDSYLNMANCLYRKKDYRDALNTYKKAIKMCNGCKEENFIFYQMASCYRNLKLSNKAKVVYKGIKGEPFWERISANAIEDINWEDKYKEFISLF